MRDDNELIENFRAGYVEDMAAAGREGTLEGPEHTLEVIDAFLRCGFDACAADHIDEFEERYGIEFEELLDGTYARHLTDPRGE